MSSVTPVEAGSGHGSRPWQGVLARVRRQPGPRIALWFLWLALLVGVLAPLVTNEFPLFAVSDGTWWCQLVACW